MAEQTVDEIPCCLQRGLLLRIRRPWALVLTPQRFRRADASEFNDDIRGLQFAAESSVTVILRSRASIASAATKP